MITNTKILEKYCKDYKNIENYEDAVRSPLIYDLHHRLEIDEMQTRSDLKFLHLYFHRPPEELIFLEHGEHMRLHNMNMSTETRKKKADAMKGNQCAMGHHCSAETRQKISENNRRYWKGKPRSPETRQKMSEAHKGKAGTCIGKHWHLEDGHRIWTE